jgi:SAM-dependent methyltransferase
MSADALTALYGRDYFFGEEYANYVEDRHVLEKNFAARLETLRRFLTPSHRRLFEIGAAYGFFLNLAREIIPGVSGIDVSPDAVHFANRQFGLAVTRGDFLDAELGGEPIDVLCLWDTIEHLAAPRRYLEKAAAHMRPGSLVAITTGDIASANARRQQARWRLIHPPTHVHYFTRQSLTTLLERCGFRVLHVEYCGAYRSIGGMLQNLVGLRWGWRRLGAFLQAAVPPRLDGYINLHDIMYIVAERR